MNKRDDEISSGYDSDVSRRNAYNNDLAKLSNINSETKLFDDNNEERLFFKLECFSDHPVERSFLKISAHCNVLLIVMVNSITFLTVCDTINYLAAVVSALFPTCLEMCFLDPKDGQQLNTKSQCFIVGNNSFGSAKERTDQQKLLQLRNKIQAKFHKMSLLSQTLLTSVRLHFYGVRSEMFQNGTPPRIQLGKHCDNRILGANDVHYGRQKTWWN